MFVGHDGNPSGLSVCLSVLAAVAALIAHQVMLLDDPVRATGRKHLELTPGEFLLAERFRSNLPDVNIAGWDGEPLKLDFTAERDDAGVIHIVANDSLSLAAGLGYAQAADRMAHIDLVRLFGQGRLSEVVENSAEARFQDQRNRAYGFQAAAELRSREMTPDARISLEAYAAGVNHWLYHASNGKPAAQWIEPLELRLVGHYPEPWSASDCLLVVEMLSYVSMAESQDGAQRLAARMLQRAAADALGVDVADPIDLLAPSSTELHLHGAGHRAEQHPEPAPAKTPGMQRIQQLQALLSPLLDGVDTGRDTSREQEPAGDVAAQYAALSGAVPGASAARLAGDSMMLLPFVHLAEAPLEDWHGMSGQLAGSSNNWVTHGNLTATGAPLMAADPHLDMAPLPPFFQPIGMVLRDNSSAAQQSEAVAEPAQVEVAADGSVAPPAVPQAEAEAATATSDEPQLIWSGVGSVTPGTPLVLYGRLGNLSMSMTYGHMDAIDLFIEEVATFPARHCEGDQECPELLFFKTASSLVDWAAVEAAEAPQVARHADLSPAERQAVADARPEEVRQALAAWDEEHGATWVAAGVRKELIFHHGTSGEATEVTVHSSFNGRIEVSICPRTGPVPGNAAQLSGPVAGRMSRPGQLPGAGVVAPSQCLPRWGLFFSQAFAIQYELFGQGEFMAPAFRHVADEDRAFGFGSASLGRVGTAFTAMGRRPGGEQAMPLHPALAGDARYAPLASGESARFAGDVARYSPIPANFLFADTGTGPACTPLQQAAWGADVPPTGEPCGDGGNIVYVAAGVQPQRVDGGLGEGAAMAPLLGFDDRHVWRGVGSSRNKAYEHNPKRGYLATANSATLGGPLAADESAAALAEEAFWLTDPDLKRARDWVRPEASDAQNSVVFHMGESRAGRARSLLQAAIDSWEASGRPVPSGMPTCDDEPQPAQCPTRGGGSVYPHGEGQLEDCGCVGQPSVPFVGCQFQRMQCDAFSQQAKDVMEAIRVAGAHPHVDLWFPASEARSGAEAAASRLALRSLGAVAGWRHTYQQESEGAAVFEALYEHTFRFLLSEQGQEEARAVEAAARVAGDEALAAAAAAEADRPRLFSAPEWAHLASGGPTGPGKLLLQFHFHIFDMAITGEEGRDAHPGMWGAVGGAEARNRALRVAVAAFGGRFRAAAAAFQAQLQQRATLQLPAQHAGWSLTGPLGLPTMFVQGLEARLAEVLRAGASPPCGGTWTPDGVGPSAACDERAASQPELAGSGPAVMSWGHQQRWLSRHHMLTERLPHFLGLDKGPHPARGGRGSLLQYQPMLQPLGGKLGRIGPVMRMIADLGESRLAIVEPGGPSGRWMSRYYSSQLDDVLACRLVWHERADWEARQQELIEARDGAVWPWREFKYARKHAYNNVTAPPKPLGGWWWD